MNTKQQVKKHTILVVFSLLLCALIYIFYRPEGTLINIFLNPFVPGSFLSLKETIRLIFPLHEVLIYSLPGGLWVFSATLVARNLRLRIFNSKVNLEWLPMIFALWLEFCQYFGIVKGQFDVLDIIFVLLFGFIVKIFFNRRPQIITTYNLQSQQSIAFTLIFLCVFMAHVFE